MSWHLLEDQYAVSLSPLPPAALEDVPHKTVKVKDRRVTVVPHRYDVVETLRSRGMLAPSMERTYGYPGRFAPRDNQRKTVEFLLDHKRCSVLNGLRSGKTLSALWAADCLIKHGQIRRVLIVAPKSILQDVWAKEFFFSFPHRSYAIVEGVRKRKQQIAQNPEIRFLIVNPESLALIEEHLPMVDLVITDEATRMKNWRAQRTRALYRISLSTRLWLMTATPAPQAPTDAYGLIKLQRGGKYISFAQFRDRTMMQVSQFKWVAKREAGDIIAKELQPAIRFRAEECYDIPETQILDRTIPLSPAQSRMVKSFQAEAFAELEGKTITAANAAASLSKCLQVMAGGVYGDTHDGERPAYMVDASPFFEAVSDIVEEADGPVLIFAPFRITAALVHVQMVKSGYRSAVVTAGTTGRQRSQIFDQVRNNELDAMVAIPQTVSHGLDLSRSNTILWLSPPMSYEVYEQANARISGSGQTRKCATIRLSQNRLTDALYGRLDTRASLQETILDLLTGG